MVKIRSGITRVVILIGIWAIKIPNPSSTRRFCWGILSNLQEEEYSKIYSPFVAKVKYRFPFGLILISERLLPINTVIYEAKIKDWKSKSQISERVLDLKPENFGIHPKTGEFLLLDYGEIT